MNDQKINVNDLLKVYKQKIADLAHQNVILEARLNALQNEGDDDKRSKK
ncbi:hypothetical protein SAMN05192559_10815 [Halobacillus karajensis]|uniref:Uncharacterized protein n=1 Tax=Halobacillus karajensis TaxID=195088 RepID=A0A024P5T5_9BACI|nr:hypothetical protein [Halobacillus karajensis]CDQ20848.1 hypothetical protein BN982_03203 [Halobacillus karajensis]CDQ23682.1 hypothetical protein BN983_01933 [Halobacillus karajensis]CDQ27160.1 hypothetical protein BN981_01414 [Halobacillus karajensis]SEI03731.1 hypothetical protein SAMN05192559_10815 [Halobacillus karajensis]